MTDSDGHYVFDDLPPGDYQVIFSDLPTDFTFTTVRTPGAAATDDSDAGANGATEVFTIEIGEPQVRERNNLDGDLVAFYIDSTRDAGLLPPELIVAPAPPELPNTGVNAGTPLMVALLLLLLGGALTLITRRREDEIA